MSCCFCKQKTAYEMRISDWSSDVCSSDLAMRDHAVGEKVDLVIGESGQVRIDVENFVPPKNREHDYRITVTNANPRPADVELGFEVDDSDRVASRLRKLRSEEHTSELQSLMSSSNAVFRFQKKHSARIHITKTTAH